MHETPATEAYIPLDPDADNSTIWASGGMYAPDNRTDAEKAADAKRWRRQSTVAKWKWRLRGLLPRGWKYDDDDHVECCNY